MKKRMVALALIFTSSLSYAKVQTYTILHGGGVDDTALELKDHQGKKIHAYCLTQCGAWFEPSKEHDGETLQSKYKGQKVVARLSYEQNKDRIVGPSNDEKLFFIQKIKLIK